MEWQHTVILATLFFMVATFYTTVDSDAFASGQHVLRARAIDAAGQPSAWTPLTVQFGGARTQPAGFTRNEGFAGGLVDLNNAPAIADFVLEHVGLAGKSA